jgi:hypothetical protein
MNSDRFRPNTGALPASFMQGCGFFARLMMAQQKTSKNLRSKLADAMPIRYLSTFSLLLSLVLSGCSRRGSSSRSDSLGNLFGAILIVGCGFLILYVIGIFFDKDAKSVSEALKSGVAICMIVAMALAAISIVLKVLF